MNKAARAKMILAMEYICRQINNEEVFDSWLMQGIADGDIPYGSTDIADVDDCYLEDNTFKDIMNCFLRRMSATTKQGGLYCDNILTDAD